MKLRFKEQQYQIDAVNAICDIFYRQQKEILLKIFLIKKFYSMDLLR